MIAKNIINQSKQIFGSDNMLKSNVSSSDIKSLEKKCRKYLGESNKNLEQIIQIFNGLMVEVGKLIARELPLNEDIKTLNKGLTTIIKINYAEPICMFIKNIYIHPEYVNSLKKGRDDFFIGASKDILKKHSNVIGDNEDNIKKFFEFKTYWGRLNDNVKNKIKEIMMTIIDLTEKYIEVKDDSNDVANILFRIDTIC